MPMKRIAIVGGGISGLSAAFVLEEHRRSGAPLEYVLYESGSRFGGVVLTECVDRCLVEAGPDSFLTEKSGAADLCRQIGLGDQLIGSNDAQRKTYILAKGRLVPMPDGLMFMVPTKILPLSFSPLFSFSTKLRMLRECFLQPRNGPDETVAAFVGRHYGAEVVERLADPLLAGVYGGEASQLSVRSVLPRFAEMESKYGSLSRGMLAGRRKASAASTPAPPIFTSLKNGMQSLVDALISRLNRSALRANTSVQDIRPATDGWLVSATGPPEFFDAVILATPAPATAKLVRTTSPELAAELGSIPYSSSVTVTLGFDQNVRASLPGGFGLLVPRSEGKRMLAATFVHNKFDHRAPEGRALIRCFLGGSRDEQVVELSDDAILHIVREELKILGIAAEPLFARLYKWRSSMAQYNLGHLERRERIERLGRQLPRLALAGNAYDGIGVPDCILSGKAAAEQVLGAIG